MNIMDLIRGNLRAGPSTLRFPERPAPAGGFRGLVTLNAEGCLGCGTCGYVCPSGAVRVDDRGSGCDWVYDPGRCTFCGRCADLCLGGALSMDGSPAPVYGSPGALVQIHHVEYPACPECGRPARPISESLLARAFEVVTEEIRRRSRLCDRCRLREMQRGLMASAIGPLHEAAGRGGKP